MLIKIKASCSGVNFSFTPGQEQEVDDALGKDLISAGYAEAVKKPSTTGRKKTTEEE